MTAKRFLLAITACFLLLCSKADAANVEIAWGASLSPEVVSYRVYCSGTINSHRIGADYCLEIPAVAGTTQYTAMVNVPYVPGTTAYLVVTAINGAGLESIPTAELPVLLTTSTVAPPVLAPIAGKSIAIGETLAFTLTATDPNNYPLFFSSNNRPAGSTLDNASGIFIWTPDNTQVGTYSVNFIASNGSNSDLETAAITVSPGSNRPPILAAIGNRTILVNKTITINLSATDPDGDTLTYSGSNLPTGYSLDKSSGVFTWLATTLQGAHIVTFAVSDGQVSDYETITISVNATPNSPPTLIAVENKVATVGQRLSFNLSASDPDGDTLFFSGSNLPPGISLDANTGAFSWTPTAAQVGNYTLTFSVTDGEDSDYKTVAITVEAVPNQLPVLAAVGTMFVNPDSLLAFTLSATDGDGDQLTFTSYNLPSGATLGAATGSFAWTPTVSQLGAYSIDFVAGDGAGTDTITVQINVDELTMVLNDITSPVDVISGDVTGDGVTDLIVLDDESNEVLTYQGNGKGTFNLLNKDATTGRPVTGKSKKNKTPSTSELVVLMEDASVTTLSRTLGEAALYDSGIYMVYASPPDAGSPAVESFAPTDLDIGDLDGDGLLDAVVTRLGTNDVAVLFRSPDNGFTEAYSLQTGLAPISVLLKDFDLDGFEDMAVSNSQGYGVSIYLGSPGGDYFTYIDEIATGSSPGHIASDDFDLDGIPDMAIPDKEDGTITICLGNGDGTFLTLHYYTVAYAPFIIEASDLNNDQISDLAVLSSDDGYVHLFYGQGDGYFTGGGRLRAGENPVSLMLEDFDGDGTPEVVVSDPGLQQVTLMRTSQAETDPGEAIAPATAPLADGGGGGSCFLDTLLK